MHNKKSKINNVNNFKVVIRWFFYIIPMFSNNISLCYFYTKNKFNIKCNMCKIAVNILHMYNLYFDYVYFILSIYNYFDYVYSIYILILTMCILSIYNIE